MILNLFGYMFIEVLIPYPMKKNLDYGPQESMDFLESGLPEVFCMETFFAGITPPNCNMMTFETRLILSDSRLLKSGWLEVVLFVTKPAGVLTAYII